ncbi:MAG: 4-hydroxy-3-methylbut-2-enyl diphosphate reductase [Chloroflexota bacterium]
MIEQVILVSPRGFCAGVVRAIATVERALALFGPPVYVRRAVVHNAHVAAGLSAAGAVFVNEVDDVPRGSVVVFGAHGVAMCVRDAARDRDLRIVDATCPLVAKVHAEVTRFRGAGYDVVLIGHPGHDEVVGTLGQITGVQLVEDVRDVAAVQVRRPDRVACVTQTTLRDEEVEPVVDALRDRFPMLEGPSADICYATRNRQRAIKWLATRVDVVLVVGDRTSSNSQHLQETAARACRASYLIESADRIQRSWLSDARVVGVCAGASTPDDLVSAVVERLRRDGADLQEHAVVEERVAFRLPAGAAVAVA